MSTSPRLGLAYLAAAQAQKHVTLNEALRRLEARGGFPYPASQTPWQEIQRGLVGQLNTGAILEGAEKHQRIAETAGCPRDNH